MNTLESGFLLCLYGDEVWVPHISLVFREMWVYRRAFWLSTVVDPYLAKNKRDMGHPSFVAAGCSLLLAECP